MEKRNVPWFISMEMAGPSWILWHTPTGLDIGLWQPLGRGASESENPLAPQKNPLAPPKTCNDPNEYTVYSQTIPQRGPCLETLVIQMQNSEQLKIINSVL